MNLVDTAKPLEPEIRWLDRLPSLLARIGYCPVHPDLLETHEPNCMSDFSARHNIPPLVHTNYRPGIWIHYPFSEWRRRNAPGGAYDTSLNETLYARLRQMWADQ